MHCTSKGNAMHPLVSVRFLHVPYFRFQTHSRTAKANKTDQQDLEPAVRVDSIQGRLWTSLTFHIGGISDAGLVLHGEVSLQMEERNQLELHTRSRQKINQKSIVISIRDPTAKSGDDLLMKYERLFCLRRCYSADPWIPNTTQWYL